MADHRASLAAVSMVAVLAASAASGCRRTGRPAAAATVVGHGRRRHDPSSRKRKLAAIGMSVSVYRSRRRRRAHRHLRLGAIVPRSEQGWQRRLLSRRLVCGRAKGSSAPAGTRRSTSDACQRRRCADTSKPRLCVRLHAVGRADVHAHAEPRRAEQGQYKLRNHFAGSAATRRRAALEKGANDFARS
jgi:hypothetical protein